MLAFGVSLFGFASDHVGKGLKNLYDIVIFLPLKVEEVVVSSRARGAADVQEVDRRASTA
jgi:hypothetical protein